MSGGGRSAYALDAGLIVQTIERLQARIEARFPASGLSAVCASLAEAGRLTAEKARALARPYSGLRLLALLSVVIWLGLQGYVASLINWRDVWQHSDLVGITQALDSAVNLLLLMFAANWFLWTWEMRLKRKRVYRDLYRLRALAHVIDMHQLTKDPSIELVTGPVTAVSPARAMSDFELSRYLDYCTEMLALIAKLAALYAGATQDSEIVTAANEIEDLTTNLGRKIWQKIMIISEFPNRT